MRTALLALMLTVTGPATAQDLAPEADSVRLIPYYPSSNNHAATRAVGSVMSDADAHDFLNAVVGQSMNDVESYSSELRGGDVLITFRKSYNYSCQYPYICLYSASEPVAPAESTFIWNPSRSAHFLVDGETWDVVDYWRGGWWWYL